MQIRRRTTSTVSHVRHSFTTQNIEQHQVKNRTGALLEKDFGLNPHS
jgi:hypothetical protein